MKTHGNALRWLARVLCILAILFVSLFALDSFSPEMTFLQNASAFLKHLIPSFVLIAVLIVAWNREKAGGISLTAIGVAWCVFLFVFNLQRTHSVSASLLIVLLLGIPFVLSGVLFLASYFKRKKELPANQEA